MSKKLLNDIKKVAIEAAQSAGEIVLREFKKKNLKVNNKRKDGKTELVSEADLKSEKIIIKTILKNYFF